MRDDGGGARGWGENEGQGEGMRRNLCVGDGIIGRRRASEKEAGVCQIFSSLL